MSRQTNACFNFDPRRAAGNQVLLFSCGGRADGQGTVTNSQQFAFGGGAGPLALSPENSAGTCLTVKGAVVDQATCNKADANQSFTFAGAAGSAAAGTGATNTSGAAVSTAAANAAPAATSSAAAAAASKSSSPCAL